MPIPSSYYYGQSSNSGYTSEPVNTALGNYTYQHADLKMPGRGIGIDFARNYNSVDSYQGPLGYGWSHTYNVFVYAPDAESAFVKYGDGHTEGYTANGDGTFTPKHGGIYSTLVQNLDSTYTLTDKAGARYSFGSDGRLSTVIDKNGNMLTLTYTGLALTSVTDPTGRAVVLSYDLNGRIIQLCDPLGRLFSYGYDVNGDLVSVEDAGGGVWAYEYDASHQMTRITNPRGNTLAANVYADGKVVSQTNGRGYTTSFAYDTPIPGDTTIIDPLGNAVVHTHNDDHQLVKEQDARGSSLIYTYDGNGNRVQVQDKRGSVTVFTYDSKGNITSRTDALGNVTTITYDANNNPLARVDPLGATTTYTYDGSGNLISTTDALGGVTLNGYDGFGELTETVDPLGHPTTFAYDASGNLVTVRDALNHTRSFTYDAAGRKTSETDANGYTMRYAYDASGNVTTVTDALGSTTRFSYDPNDNKISETDRNGRTTTYAYDEDEKLTAVTDPLGNTTTMTYDALDRKIATTSPLSATTTITYDEVGNPWKVQDGLGNITTSSYDAAGNRIGATNPLGQTTNYGYDALNRLISVTDPLGNTTQSTYDAMGRLATRTDARDYTTSYAYDSMGRLIRVLEPGGGITSYTYDAVGNKTSTIDARGKLTTYAYDAANRLVSETDPLGGTKAYAYDDAGNLARITKADGVVITYQYDNVNRLVRLAYPSGTPTTFQYDANGNRTQMTDALGTSSWSFDAMNRMVSYTDPFGSTVGYGYDANGRRAQMTYPGNHVLEYTYDGANRLTLIRDWLGNQTDYQYNAAGQLIYQGHPNGSVAFYAYDNASRPSGLINLGNDASVLSSYVYTLDASGNITGEERTEPISPDYTACLVGSSFDEDNRIEVSGTIVYSHDVNGNRTAQGGANAGAFTYDFSDRLTTVTGFDGLFYQYDGMGNRLSRAQSGLETRYVQDVSAKLPRVIAETDSLGQATAYYIHGVGLAYKLLPNGETYTYHYDSRGSTVLLTNGVGEIVNQYAYAPFGELVHSAEAVSNPFGFAGRYGIMEEGRGLKFMRARFYDSETGRFLNRDLLSGDRLQPQSLNRYIYALNNPVRYLDTTGLITESSKNSLINSGNYSSDKLHAKLYLYETLEKPDLGETINSNDHDWEWVRYHGVMVRVRKIKENSELTGSEMIKVWYRDLKSTLGIFDPVPTLEDIFTPEDPRYEIDENSFRQDPCGPFGCKYEVQV